MTSRHRLQTPYHPDSSKISKDIGYKHSSKIPKVTSSDSSSEEENLPSVAVLKALKFLQCCVGRRISNKNRFKSKQDGAVEVVV